MAEVTGRTKRKTQWKVDKMRGGGGGEGGRREDTVDSHLVTQNSTFRMGGNNTRNCGL